MRVALLIWALSAVALHAQSESSEAKIYWKQAGSIDFFEIRPQHKEYAKITFTEPRMFILVTEKGNVTISLKDGKVTPDEGVDMNEAAKVFWKAVESIGGTRK